jgi:hypothetical protein
VSDLNDDASDNQTANFITIKITASGDKQNNNTNDWFIANIRLVYLAQYSKCHEHHRAIALFSCRVLHRINLFLIYTPLQAYQFYVSYHGA